MTRKKGKKQKIKEENTVIQASPVLPDTTEGNIKDEEETVAKAPQTIEETMDDDGVVEISNKAKLLAIVKAAPKVPEVNSKMFLRMLNGDFKPRYERLLTSLREIAECLT